MTLAVLGLSQDLGRGARHSESVVASCLDVTDAVNLSRLSGRLEERSRETSMQSLSVKCGKQTEGVTAVHNGKYV